MCEELDGIEVFVAVAGAKGFRAAGERLRVSGSAVSQTLRKLLNGSLLAGFLAAHPHVRDKRTKRGR